MKKFRTRNGPNRGRIHLRFTENESSEGAPTREVEIDAEGIDLTTIAKWTTIAMLIAGGAHGITQML